MWPGSTLRLGKRSVFHEGNGPLLGLFVPPDWPIFWSENYGWFCSVLEQSSHRILQNLAFEFLLLTTKIWIHPLIQPSPLLWSTAQLSQEIVNNYIPQSWILSSNKQTLLVEGICRNEDLRSAVVVGLLHNSLKNLPHYGRMNFWLTVLTGISDPELVFGFHSSHVVMCVVIFRTQWIQLLRIRCWRGRNWICKNVFKYTMRVPNAWRPIFAARHFQRTA